MGMSVCRAPPVAAAESPHTCGTFAFFLGLSVQGEHAGRGVPGGRQTILVSATLSQKCAASLSRHGAAALAKPKAHSRLRCLQSRCMREFLRWTHGV